MLLKKWMVKLFLRRRICKNHNMESQSKLPGPVNQTSNILPWRPTYLSCVMGFVLHQQLLCVNYRALYQNLFLFGTDYTICFSTLEMIDKNYRVQVKWIEINRREGSLLEYCTCVYISVIYVLLCAYAHMMYTCMYRKKSFILNW